MTSTPGKRGARPSKSETVSVRLDPKLRYLADLAARKQRRSLSSYIEWAVERSLTEVLLYEGQSYNDQISVADEANNLWDVDPAERFVLLATKYPELMDMIEQERWKMLLDSMLLDPAKGRNSMGMLQWNWATLEDAVMPVLRRHWDSLVVAHEKGAPAMREWIDDMRGQVKSGKVYPPALLTKSADTSQFDDEIPF